MLVLGRGATAFFSVARRGFSVAASPRRVDAAVCRTTENNANASVVAQRNFQRNFQRNLPVKRSGFSCMNGPDTYSFFIWNFRGCDPQYKVFGFREEYVLVSYSRRVKVFPGIIK